ncbi:hypothetical protein CMV_027451 [Castanea mollissima]|uniref:Uncharacterized protein n=1 Tax=Castanea mollissima TaxID=60419 RepID=A0A8J4QA56_9ROSI|nr:hypothetical protein CMV_027451 [Castanea mollissima]
MLFMDFFGINEETHLSEYDFPRMIEPEEIDQSTVDPKFDQFDELVSRQQSLCRPHQYFGQISLSLPHFDSAKFRPNPTKSLPDLAKSSPFITRLTNSTFDHHPMRHDSMCLVGQLQVSFFPNQSVPFTTSMAGRTL